MLMVCPHFSHPLIEIDGTVLPILWKGRKGRPKRTKTKILRKDDSPTSPTPLIPLQSQGTNQSRDPRLRQGSIPRPLRFQLTLWENWNMQERKCIEKHTLEAYSHMHAHLSPYVQSQFPDTPQNWNKYQSLASLLHFQELEDLQASNPGTPNIQRTMFYKLGRAMRVAQGRGVPLHLIPRYPDTLFPPFYNNGEVQSDTELLHEFLALSQPIGGVRVKLIRISNTVEISNFMHLTSTPVVSMGKKLTCQHLTLSHTYFDPDPHPF